MQVVTRCVVLAAMLTCLQQTSVFAQDSLLLTNGKVRNLKGVVVHFDHNEILYQNDRQQKRMRAFIHNREVRQLRRQSQASWKKKQERLRKKLETKKQQAAAERELRKEEREAKLQRKMLTLSAAEFEKWKKLELDRLAKIDQQQQLEAELNQQSKRLRKSRKEARHRRRFTRRISRDLVFSILKADSTEVIVYNADTLGFFADGEPEVEYGVAEMRMYIKGRQDGRKHRTALDAIIGVGVGAISSGAGAYWGPSIPAAYIVITSIANIRLRKMISEDPALLAHPAYLDGYERSAKRKKTWSFVKGSVAGLGFGMLMWDGIVRGEGLPGPR